MFSPQPYPCIIQVCIEKKEKFFFTTLSLYYLGLYRVEEKYLLRNLIHVLSTSVQSRGEMISPQTQPIIIQVSLEYRRSVFSSTRSLYYLGLYRVQEKLVFSPQPYSRIIQVFIEYSRSVFFATLSLYYLGLYRVEEKCLLRNPTLVLSKSVQSTGEVSVYSATLSLYYLGLFRVEEKLVFTPQPKHDGEKIHCSYYQVIARKQE